MGPIKKFYIHGQILCSTYRSDILENGLLGMMMLNTAVVHKKPTCIRPLLFQVAQYSVEGSGDGVICQPASSVCILAHWLPVQFCIHYKNLLLTYKALHHLAPSYLCDLLQDYSPSRTLRSTSAGLLTIPTSCLSTMGARAFSCSAPRLWNSLPPHIRQSDFITTFKSKLKTHLFKLAYSL